MTAVNATRVPAAIITVSAAVDGLCAQCNRRSLSAVVPLLRRGILCARCWVDGLPQVVRRSDGTVRLDDHTVASGRCVCVRVFVRSCAVVNCVRRRSARALVRAYVDACVRGGLSRSRTIRVSVAPTPCTLRAKVERVHGRISARARVCVSVCVKEACVARPELTPPRAARHSPVYVLWSLASIVRFGQTLRRMYRCTHVYVVGWENEKKKKV